MEILFFVRITGACLLYIMFTQYFTIGLNKNAKKSIAFGKNGNVRFRSINTSSSEKSTLNINSLIHNNINNTTVIPTFINKLMKYSKSNLRTINSPSLQRKVSKIIKNNTNLIQKKQERYIQSTPTARTILVDHARECNRSLINKTGIKCVINHDPHNSLSDLASSIVGLGFIPGILMLFICCRYFPVMFSTCKDMINN